MPMHDRIVPHLEYETPAMYEADATHTFICGRSEEERGNYVEELAARFRQSYVLLEHEVYDQLTVTQSGLSYEVNLRRTDEIAALVSNCTSITLDITTLPHHLWAPLLKCAHQSKVPCEVLYCEPQTYTETFSPEHEIVYDLSERIRGISPIPTFANLKHYASESTWFVPLLGFEGIRFSYVYGMIEPEDRKIIPVIGVPGFTILHPFRAYNANQKQLQDSNCWDKIRFAPANCPFSLCDLLLDLKADHPSDLFQIALIGTKPHALGAVLFALLAENSELVYDYPVKKAGRTVGAGILHKYNISEYLIQHG